MGGALAQDKAIRANATAFATNLTLNATTIAYKQLSDKVGITPANILDQFIYYSDLQTTDSHQLLFNIK